jgi:hypothetical protein
VINQPLGEDGLNIVQSTFTLRNCHFSSAVSDAFDGDFSKGRIEKCVFEDIQGDALDFSGSEIKAQSLYFKNIKDKAVSAGEKSYVHLNNLEVINSGIGVASKDASFVKILNSKFKDIRLFGLAAYTKKNEYGAGGAIEANHFQMTGSGETAKAQIGSQIILDQKPVETVNLDVNLMYFSELLKK